MTASPCGRVGGRHMAATPCGRVDGRHGVATHACVRACACACGWACVFAHLSADERRDHAVKPVVNNLLAVIR